MNPKLMAALRARRKPAPVQAEMAESATGDTDDAAVHHKELRRHLEAGLNGSRRAAKVHLRLALHHHRRIHGED